MTGNMLNGKKVTIVSLGLMGSSLGLALKKQYPKAEIIGLSRRDTTIRKAKKKRIINWGSTEFSKAVKDADFIIICSPVNQIIPFLKKIDPLAKSGAIVTDVGSTKGSIAKWSNAYCFKNIRFVGSHPLVGSHEKGLSAARQDLYKNGICFVIKEKKTNQKALDETVRFWKGLKQEVKIVSAKEHDKIVASISHLPHIIASCLVLGAESKKMNFAGSGFKDTTRIAQGDPHLWVSIFEDNRGNLIKELRAFQKQINTFLKLLTKNQSSRILKVLKEANIKRVKVD